jgi:hypothetical protein
MEVFKKIWQTIIASLGLIIILSGISLAESVALSWDAPTTNTDGTPITDLAGFKIYQGTASGVYGSLTDVGNVLCFVVTGLTVGITYYFAVTAYNTASNESDYSNEVSKAITTGMSGSCSGDSIHLNWKSRNKSTGGFGGGFQ